MDVPVADVHSAIQAFYTMEPATTNAARLLTSWVVYFAAHMPAPPKSNSERQIERLIHAAEEAWSQQDYAKSISLVEQASGLDPHNPSLVLQLAKGHGLRYDFATAQRHIEKAVALSPTRVQTLTQAGETCLEFEHLDMAIRYLERASREADVTIGALVTLTDIYVREGRIDDAADMAARAAWIDRDDPRVLLVEARVRRARGQVGEAESILRTMLTKPASTDAARIRGLYELAGLLDASARYDEAMSALLEVKAIQRATAAPYAATLQLMQTRAKEMEASISAAVLARWRADAAKLHPPRRIALLCGHPRSGTTLLEQVLDGHRDIISAEETKLMHDEAYLPLVRDFPEGTSVLAALDASPPSVLMRARANYFDCTEKFIEKTIGGRLLIDKNPGLNVMIPMVVRIFPEAKFLVALRDPRDVVLSCFMQALPPTPISSAYLSLEGTVTQYASSMGFWLEMRPRMGEGQWMEVRYERLVDDLPAVTRATLAFLGVEFDENVLRFHEHARTKRVKSPSHADVIKPLYRTAVGRWRNYQQYLEPYLGGLERFVKALGYG